MEIEDLHTDVHVHVHNRKGASKRRVRLLEEKVMGIVENLTALQTTVAEFNEDIAAKVAALEAAQGEFTVEGQAAFDALKAAVESGVVAVGDADGDGTPAAPVE